MNEKLLKKEYLKNFQLKKYNSAIMIKTANYN